MQRPAQIEGCVLQRTLGKWAACFTPHHALQVKLVEDTITETLKTLSSRGDEAAIDRELFLTMRRLALRAFGLAYALPDSYPLHNSFPPCENTSMERL
ncbi:hypothetical protein [Agrobacterium pusense]|mgnify:FL=1|uniref:hypothetical protein n=1 Tax=Agrobacterium pusense TaxID=648995 RepID=UPI001572BB74|nr:hypothetical protein [Agrobacterium pusense]NTE48065.1 hypothetical protein [Agrobacterium pusense]